MARLELVYSGILFINADPAHYHVFASHVHPLQLSVQEFIATYQRRDGMYATNANMVLSRSLDGGITWTAAQLPPLMRRASSIGTCNPARAR